MILDTSVNHLPESFEYQWRPDVLMDIDDGRYSYIFAGSTCLAGDVFGEYSFAEPLEIGSKVVMYGVGSYNLVKAHTFNGFPLPSIYILDAHGEVALVKEFTLREQSRKWGLKPVRVSEIEFQLPSPPSGGSLLDWLGQKTREQLAHDEALLRLVVTESDRSGYKCEATTFQGGGNSHRLPLDLAMAFRKRRSENTGASTSLC